MEASEVWDIIHGLFDTDDGSLPEIELKLLTGENIRDIYSYLKDRGQDVTVNGAQFWDKTINDSRPITSVDNPAFFVVQYLAEPFHMVIGGIKTDNIIIPPLGFFVFQEGIFLDYRKGQTWNPENVTGLLYLLCELNRVAPGMQISFQAGKAKGIQESLQIVWERFKKENCY